MTLHINDIDTATVLDRAADAYAASRGKGWVCGRANQSPAQALEAAGYDFVGFGAVNVCVGFLHGRIVAVDKGRNGYPLAVDITEHFYPNATTTDLPKVHLVTHGDTWSVMNGGVPACKPTSEARARTYLKSLVGDTPVAVWDATIGLWRNTADFRGPLTRHHGVDIENLLRHDRHDRAERSDTDPGFGSCLLCGRSTHDRPLQMVLCHGGGPGTVMPVAGDYPHDAIEAEPGFMGMFAVGPTCAKKVQQAAKQQGKTNPSAYIDRR